MNELLAINQLLIVVLAVVIGSIMLAAGIKDILRALKDRLSRPSSTKVPSSQLTLTILIDDFEKASDITECLDLVARDDYSLKDIVVMTHAKNRKRTLKYKESFDVPFTVYCPRTKIADSLSLLNAYRKSAHGEVIMVIKSSDKLLPRALRSVSSFFQIHPSVELVKLEARTMFRPRIDSLATIFIEQSRLMMRKAFGVNTAFTARPSGSSYALRPRALKTSVKGTRDMRSRTSIVENILTRMEGERLGSASTLATYLFLALITVTLLTSAFLGSTFVSSQPLFLTWMAIGTWLIFIIWSDEALNLDTKWRLLLCVPVCPFLLAGVFMIHFLVRLGSFRLSANLVK